MKKNKCKYEKNKSFHQKCRFLKGDKWKGSQVSIIEITVNSIINKSTHKNLEGLGSDMYSNTAVWKVKQIYPNFPSGFHCKRIKYKSHGGKQSTIKLKTLTRKEIYPMMLYTSECSGFFSLLWNFQHLREFGIFLLPIPCHYSHLIHLSNSNS